MELEIKYNQAENCLNLVPVEYPSAEQQEPLKKIHLVHGVLCVESKPVVSLDVVQINFKKYFTLQKSQNNPWDIEVFDEYNWDLVSVLALVMLGVEVYAVLYSTGNVH